MLKNKLFSKSLLDKILEDDGKKEEDGFQRAVDFRGEVEIKAWKDGKLFYHDGGPNAITLWARHANIHLLSGNSYSSQGGEIGTWSQPVQNSHSTLKNLDGILLSGEQYFWDWPIYDNNFKHKYPEGNSEYKFPFFPTKMLFGTGFEFDTYTNAPQVFKTKWEADPINNLNEATFNSSLKEQTANFYSNRIFNNSLERRRTVNDILAGPISENQNLIENDVKEVLLSENYSRQYGINGAIKNGGINEISGGTNLKSELDGSDPGPYDQNQGRLKDVYRGIGRPAFIYANRTPYTSIYNTAQEICVRADEGSQFDNRVSFTVVMPEQTNQQNTFYPYNGWIIKEAGLFCDAVLRRGGATSFSPESDGYAPFKYMPNGIMIAKRKITPITKTADVRIAINWSLFL